MSILDQILQEGSNKKGLTARDFFIENNPNGYMAKANFVPFINLIGKNSAQYFELTINYLGQGFKNNGLPIVKTNEENGLSLIWGKYNLAGSDQNIPFYVTERLPQFIMDCQQGKIKPRFTFEELYAAAIEQDKV